MCLLDLRKILYAKKRGPSPNHLKIKMKTENYVICGCGSGTLPSTPVTLNFISVPVSEISLAILI